MNDNLMKEMKKKIMRRIYFLYMVRNLSPLAFDCLLLILALFIVTLFVSVGNVLANLSVVSSAGGMSAYSLSAISKTEFETKILLLVLGVIGYFAVRDLKRAWKAVKIMRGKKEEPSKTAVEP